MILGHSSKVHVRFQAPIRRYIPLLTDGIFGRGNCSHVLQVCSESFKFESRPDLNLAHGVGMFTPLREHVCYSLMRLACLLDDGIVFPEENLD